MNPVYNIVQFILQKATELSITPEGIIVFTLILYGLSFFAMVMQDFIPGQIFIALIVIPGLFLFFSPISEWYTEYQYTHNPEPTDMDLSFAMLAIECTAPGVILSGILSGISIIIEEYINWNNFKKRVKNNPELISERMDFYRPHICYDNRSKKRYKYLQRQQKKLNKTKRRN